MSGRGISQLPLPPAAFRPDLGGIHNDSKKGFESAARSREEDRKRSLLLRKSAKQFPEVIDADLAHDLADRLEIGVEANDPPSTPASSLCMRDQRVRVAGALWQLYDRVPSSTLATVLCLSWEVPADDLMLVDPRQLLNGFRSDLNAATRSKPKGYLFAAIHGEFYPTPAQFNLHLHIQMSGDFIDIIDGLRKRRKYRFPAEGSNYVNGKRTPIRIARQPLTDLPGPITYLLQAFWPVKAFETATGEIKRASRQRIPEPYHSLSLLWLDRWRIEDLTLLRGLRVTKTGLSATH